MSEAETINLIINKLIFEVFVYGFGYMLLFGLFTRLLKGLLKDD